jgi:hypothetical protein
LSIVDLPAPGTATTTTLTMSEAWESDEIKVAGRLG